MSTLKKFPKAGQYVKIGQTVYRARKRKNGCEGCIFNNFFSCIQLKSLRNKTQVANECELNEVIFTTV